MSSQGWYRKLMADPENLSIALQASIWYENEYADAQKDLEVDGWKLADVEKRLPGLMAYRFSQLQEIEAIHSYLIAKEDKMKGDKYRAYLEHYDRTLTDRQAEKYADHDKDVYAMRMVRLQILYVRNLFMGITKGLEALSFQISNLNKLRIAGMEDATI